MRCKGFPGIQAASLETRPRQKASAPQTSSPWYQHPNWHSKKQNEEKPSRPVTGLLLLLCWKQYPSEGLGCTPDDQLACHRWFSAGGFEEVRPTYQSGQQTLADYSPLRPLIICPCEQDQHCAYFVVVWVASWEARKQMALFKVVPMGPHQQSERLWLEGLAGLLLSHAGCSTSAVQRWVVQHPWAT